jgi:hypothetical protein
VGEGRAHELDGQWNQEVLRALLRQAAPVTKPCGLELVAHLCGSDILADIVSLDADRLMRNLYAIAEDTAARVLGKLDLVREVTARLDGEAAYDDATTRHVTTR